MPAKVGTAILTSQGHSTSACNMLCIGKRFFLPLAPTEYESSAYKYKKVK